MKRELLKTLSIIAVGLLFCLPSMNLLAESPENIQIVEIQKIWDRADHNAFTDLIRFKGQWYCTFREGMKHVSSDGALRVIVSSDGKNWDSAALITMDGVDLRDPKFSVTPQGQLLLAGGGAREISGGRTHQSYVWQSTDGKTWSDPTPIGDKDFWIWRLVWHKDAAYGFGYFKVSLDYHDREGCLRLYKSENAKGFRTLVADLDVPSYPTEASPLFLKDGTALCLLRRDGDDDTTAMIGTAQAPYTDWTWKSLGIRIGGPQLIQLPDGRLLVVGRKYVNDVKTTHVWWLDPIEANVTEAIELPSGGDTSYPGLIYENGLLWVSYYSTHEGKTAIYLAKLRFPLTGSTIGISQ
ncbi:MAG TPA: sialidase family protein [Planctomicrobium sp.]|nr:sialidase family protein [Planctomicrobium sp.]